MSLFSAARKRTRAVADRVFHAIAGLAFTLLAMCAIQYEEVVSPEFARVSAAWGDAAMTVGRKLAELTA